MRCPFSRRRLISISFNPPSRPAACRGFAREVARLLAPLPLAPRGVGPRDDDPRARAQQRPHRLRARGRHELRRRALRARHAHRARPGRHLRPVHRRARRCRAVRGDDGRPAFVPRRRGRVARAARRHGARRRPPTRRSRCPTGSRTRGPERERTVRRRLGLAAAVPAQRPRQRGGHRRRAPDAGRARGAARLRRRDDQRAPRRLPRLPAQPAAGGRLVPRGDAARAGPRPCPLLLPLRPPALVAEEIAWLAARFPGRVGLGVASGALPRRLRHHARADGRPRGALHRARSRSSRGCSTGRRPARLADDPAIAACAQHPVPVLSAAMGFTAVRRAARLGAGLLFDSLSTPERCRELIDDYRDARRHRLVRADPAGVGRRAAARAARRPDRRVPQLLVVGGDGALGRERDGRRPHRRRRWSPGSSTRSTARAATP